MATASRYHVLSEYDDFTSTTKLALESVCTDALVIPDCEDSVLIQEALELVLRILAELPPRLSRSPVLRCLRILCNSPLNQRALILSFCNEF
jgi:hypothetical protein